MWAKLHRLTWLTIARVNLNQGPVKRLAPMLETDFSLLQLL